MTDKQRKLYQILLDVPGFNLCRFVADHEQLDPIDFRENMDHDNLLRAFPEDWDSKTDRELSDIALDELRNAQSARFKAITAQDVVTAFQKHRKLAEYVDSLKD